MKYKPKRHHRVAKDHVVERSHMAILLDPGFGKTAIILTAFDELRDRFEVDRMLVVAPPAVTINVWAQEAAKWDHTQHLSVGILHGKRKAQVLQEKHDIYVVSTDGLRWLVNQLWDWPDMLVIDESTKFKKPGTSRFKALQKILCKFDRRYAMTGTPIPNGMLDLFGQIYCVDQGYSLGRSMKAYKQEFFVPVEKKDHYVWVPRKNADKMIYERIGPRVLRMEGADIDVPKLAVMDIPIELPSKAKALYEELRKEMMINLKQGEVVALNAGSLTAKCRQLANGRVYMDDLPGGEEQRPDGHAGGRPFAFVHDAKQEALGRLVEELGGKSVLFSYEFKHDIEAIRRAVNCDVPVLKATDAGLITRWNRGLEPYMIAHPKTAGHGLNLQAGGHVLIWLGPPWDLELYQQMIKRLHRQGQEKRVQVYRLIAKGTVDEKAARVLKRKGADQQALLDALREDLS